MCYHHLTYFSCQLSHFRSVHADIMECISASLNYSTKPNQIRNFTIISWFLQYNLKRPKMRGYCYLKRWVGMKNTFENLFRGFSFFLPLRLFLSWVSLCLRPLPLSTQSIPTFSNLSKSFILSKSEHQLLWLNISPPS